jgi:hypothetical protein
MCCKLSRLGVDGTLARSRPSSSYGNLQENAMEQRQTRGPAAELARRLPLLLAVACLLTPGAGAQERPLPERERFLRETRERLQTDSSLQGRYVYVETRRELKLDTQGRTQKESVEVIESYPGLPGEDRWERVIVLNGQPRPAAELERVDRDRRRQAEAVARRLAEQPAKEQARQERALAEQRRVVAALVDDIFIAFDIEMRGREAIEGHNTIVFSLTPHPGAKPRTSEGRQMQKFACVAWVSESDHELVRLVAESVDTLSMGFGVLARLQKGSQLSFLRRKVNGEVWLPAAVSYSGAVRVGLLRMLRRSGSSEFSGYRKFTVDTAASYQSPKVP